MLRGMWKREGERSRKEAVKNGLFGKMRADAGLTVEG